MAHPIQDMDSNVVYKQVVNQQTPDAVHTVTQQD